MKSDGCTVTVQPGNKRPNEPVVNFLKLTGHVNYYITRPGVLDCLVDYQTHLKLPGGLATLA